MLSTFETLDGSTFVVWTVDTESDATVTATDGGKVWRTPAPITANDKPASRKKDSDEAFITEIKRSLHKSDASSTSPFEIEFKVVNENLQLSIKETFGTTSTKSLLLKTTLQPVEQSQIAFMNMFAEITAKMQHDEGNVATLNKTIGEYILQIDILANNTKEMGTMKDKLQDELVSKMCMVLNCKKREIERLNERIAELESVSQTENENNSETIDLTEEAAPAKKPAAKAPAKARVTKAKAAPAPRGGTAISAAAARAGKRKAAVPTTKKAAAKRRRGDSEGESDSDSEGSDSAVDSDDESSEAAFSVRSDAPSESDGREIRSDVDSCEEDLRAGGRPPKVTPGSLPPSQSHAALGISSKGSSSSADAGKAAKPVAVTLSLPISQDALPAKGSDNADSDSDGPIIKPRKSKNQSTASASSAANGAAAGSAGKSVDIVRTVTKGAVTQGGAPAGSNSAAASVLSSGAGACANGNGATAKSKFYAEDSDDEGNCMDYM